MIKNTEYKTKQKEMILSFLMKNKHLCLTAEKILTELSKKEKIVSQTTVYRTLKNLKENGIIREYAAAKGEPATYQYIGQNKCQGHLHLKCVVCGNVHHVECNFNEHINDHFLSHHNFEIDNSKTVIYGRCTMCTEKEKQK